MTLAELYERIDAVPWSTLWHFGYPPKTAEDMPRILKGFLERGPNYVAEDLQRLLHASAPSVKFLELLGDALDWPELPVLQRRSIVRYLHRWFQYRTTALKPLGEWVPTAGQRYEAWNPPAKYARGDEIVLADFTHVPPQREGEEDYERKLHIQDARGAWFTSAAWHTIERTLPRVFVALESADPLLRLEAAAMLHWMPQCADVIVPPLRKVLDAPKPGLLESVAAFSLVRVGAPGMDASLAVLWDALEGSGQASSVAAVYLAAADVDLTRGKAGIRAKRTLMKVSPALLREPCVFLKDLKSFVEHVRSHIKW